MKYKDYFKSPEMYLGGIYEKNRLLIFTKNISNYYSQKIADDTEGSIILVDIGLKSDVNNVIIFDDYIRLK